MPTKTMKIKKPSVRKRAPAAKDGLLPLANMSKAETEIVSVLNGTGKGERTPLSLKQLQLKVFGPNESPLITSPARNALRRLVRTGWVEKFDRGTYRITDKGRKRTKGKK